MRLSLLLASMLSIGCAPVINRFSFYPEKTSKDTYQQLPSEVKELFIPTDDKKSLQCFMIDRSSDKLVIFFNGNAGNVYQRIPSLIRLSNANISVLGIDYRGYGKSTGRPSEKGIYRDGAAAVKYSTESLGFAHKDIFIFGRSIGTTVAIEIGSKEKYAGIILVTPLTSAREYVGSKGLKYLAPFAGTAFDNLGKCPSIASPVLLIHGTDDEVVPFHMGKSIFEQIESEKEFVEITGGFHDNLEFRDPNKYWEAIYDFFKKYSR